MKRCPACNRVETDDALVFCRADGTALVSDSGSIGGDASTAKFESAPAASETETSILSPAVTDAGVRRATGPTTVLPAQQTSGTTHALSKSKRRKAIVAITVVIALALAVTIYFFVVRKSNVPINSIAVLPFVNERGNADVEYLSDGMTESLINSLSQLPNLSVKARSTVFHYKGKDITPQQVGSELSVQAVLNGRVVQRGDQLTLSLELVDARTGNQIWSEQYNRKTADLVSLQSKIARDVSNKLRLKLSGADEQRVTKSYTANTEAYQLYLKGLYYWNKRTHEGTRKAMEYFQQAIDKDPSYALAYVGLADSYTISTFSHTSDEKAKAAALKALEIDDTLGEAHATLGVIKEWEWYAYAGADAEREFKRAIELSPNYPTAHHWYGEFLDTRGRFDESFAEYQRALELDPLSLAISTALGTAYYDARQYDRAIEYFKELIEMDPNYVRTHFYLAQVYEEKGMFEEAIAENEKGLILDGKNPNEVAKAKTAMKDALRLSGARGYWQKKFDLGREDEQSSNPLAMASLFARLGEKDQAFVWLEKAYDERVHLEYLKVSPEWDNLRSDPRFASLLQRVGL